ncbi:hypothetical protein SAMN03159382_01738 [Pseudomonas sp. NFACC23-1]|nr:hypothetical protein SAMN03159386_01523 [Pseudomonas sp. NFACC17-2]SEJ26123.1 hypothetical protein SAMN03159382_01738 [Pseudomonas sp. NFACC23-1]SFW83926.1 hypothetical protein SAMN05660640_04192 [Pseudomonas sp. NFACC16-2]
MFTPAVFSSVFFPADWDYEYRAVRSFFLAFSVNEFARRTLESSRKKHACIEDFADCFESST